MQIQAELKTAYKAFHKECTANRVEPMPSDFLLGDPPHWVRAFIQRASDDLLAAEYNLYVAICFAKNVEPVLKNFLVGDIPDGVMSIMEHVANEVEPNRRERLAATA